MASAFRIEIRPSIHDTRTDVFTRKIKGEFPNAKVVAVTDVYTMAHDFSQEDQERTAQMLINPIVEGYTLDTPNAPENFDFAIETGFLPGVTDNLGHTVLESTEDLLKIEFNRPDEDVYSSQVIFLSGVNSAEEAEEIGKLFVNPIINRLHVRSYGEFQEKGGMDTIVPKVHLEYKPVADEVNLEVDEEELNAIGKKGVPNGDGTHRGPLALRPSYLKVIRDYFRSQGRNPKDIELEAIAQTWSEHCKHTIFADPIDDVAEGIFKRYIRKATVEIREKKGADDFCVSVFKDNSGGIIFDDEFVVTDKVETHNSPSALDPFGGAITGIVGVNRDSLGYGLGAKPVINRYGYCFGDPDTKPELYKGKDKARPALTPRTVMDGVVAGTRSGGNESGIPSPQGFAYYDERYSGKPLVYVGTVGLIPRTINGKNASEKCAQPGDRIIVAGGRVGMDGIHGATFSSEALDTGSPATAVQIGDPIVQKKMSDVIIKEARGLELYNSITDNGAGGISCSVAEMAKECGGCEVQLDRVPLKYPNLAPWQIWISESQERMTFAVPPAKAEELIELMARRGVEAVDIGEFNDSGRCIVKYGEETMLDLEMEFLHEGNPAEQQDTTYTRPTHDEPDFAEPSDYAQTMKAMIARKNIASFRFMSRQKDHEVQGGSVIKPLQGPGLVNGTANVVRPVLSSKKAVVTSQGINPRYSDIDTYAMAAASIDDAIAAAVAVGANIDYLAICDNFCWCSSNEAERLGQLKAAAEACYDLAIAYGTPYISGKDSMYNDFKGFDANNNPVKISIPPTLLVSALGVVPEATKCMSMDFKLEGDLIYVLGETKDELGASEYFAMHDAMGNKVPQVDTETAYERYQKLYQASQEEMLHSVLHIDRGGLGIALMKASISGQMGADVDLSNLAPELRNDHKLFSESKSRFLVSISPDKKDAFETLFPQAQAIGAVNNGEKLVIQGVAELSIAEITEAYHATFKDY